MASGLWVYDGVGCGIGYEGQTEFAQSFSVYKQEVAERKSELLDISVSDHLQKDPSQLSTISGEAVAIVEDTYKGKYVEGRDILKANVPIYYGTEDTEKNNLHYACGVMFLCNLLTYYRDARGMTKIESNFVNSV